MKMDDIGKNLCQSMGFDAKTREIWKGFVGFTHQDEKLLHSILPLMKKNADKFADAFYENVQKYSNLMEIIEKAGSSIDRLVSVQKSYYLELFNGEYDEAYFERRLKIGVIHNKIGLDPRWYLGSFAVYMRLITDFIVGRYFYNPPKLKRLILAVNKILTIDSELAIHTYIHGLMQDLGSVSLSKQDIEERVKVFRQFIDKVASGDLAQELTIKGNDELDELGGNLNMMTRSLAQMTSQISEAANTMRANIRELENTTTTQAAGASEQASTVNETTATLEEIKKTTAQTLEKSLALGKAAERIKEQGERGLKSVEQAVAGIQSIREKVNAIAKTILALSDKSQQIGEITESVSALAQQSKMLALNASIEAAKAGEAGKGFAVVATEVKELAEQSQQATAQVQTILQDIQRATDHAVMVTEEGSKGVDEGVNLINLTGNAIKELTEVIKETAIASQQIVAAVQQEVAGIDQIAASMSEINQSTKMFVTASNETKNASQSLGQVATSLQESVSVYKT